jgi:putative ABC transport system permease protein
MERCMVKRSRISTPDLFSEATAGLVQRPARSVLTMLGTVLGIGAFVAIVGMTATAGGQIDKRLNELVATEVVVQDIGTEDSFDTDLSFPDDAAARVKSLNGVRDAGLYWPIPQRDPAIEAAPGTGLNNRGLAVVAMEPSAFPALRPKLRMGRLYDNFHGSRKERVAVVGASAADRLGIHRLDSNPAVFINGTPYAVLGVLEDVARKPEILLSIMIPTTTALAAYGPPSDPRAQMMIETRVGAATLIATQVAHALRPDAPQRFKVVAPPNPQSLRRNVSADLNALFLLLAAISLVIGAVGIANTTFVAVMERTHEIGLRRAVGARPVHIALQFLIESAQLGLMGGLMGGSGGTGLVIIMAIVKGWTAVLPPWIVVVAPLVGTLVGLGAGLYPAISASRIEPVEALRR